MSSLIVYPDHDKFVEGAAEFIIQQARAAVAQRDQFTIALSGGGTPQPIYARLANAGSRERIDWAKVHVFFSDERCVPPDDERSNYGMAREALLDQVPLPVANVHRVQGEIDPAQAAVNYEVQVRSLFGPATFPAFDLICLGLGDNGHTASLFPGTAVLREQEHAVMAQYVEVVKMWRVTFTVPLINAARQVVFLVEGAGKAEMVWRVLYGPDDPDVLPAQLIRPAHGQRYWLMDQAAAAKVSTSPTV